jgi:hypothetical protein
VVVQERCAVADLVTRSLSVVNTTWIASMTAFVLGIRAVRLHCGLCYSGAQAVQLAYSLERHCVVCEMGTVCAAVRRRIRLLLDVVFWAREMVCCPLFNVERPGA